MAPPDFCCCQREQPAKLCIAQYTRIVKSMDRHPMHQKKHASEPIERLQVVREAEGSPSRRAALSATGKTYAELELVYDAFNAKLFGGQLPGCLLTLQREKRTYGYFSSERFGNTRGDTVDEIAINPAYVAIMPLIEVLQTIAHEMVHQWQAHFGKPGRTRYHNEAFGNKMESIGLMPSHTGKPGGRRTGDCMADYPIDGGLFLIVCAELITNDFRISWYDRFGAHAPISPGDPPAVGHDLPEAAMAIAAHEGVVLAPLSNKPGATNRSNRSKYACGCRPKINVWGKPGLDLSCNVCFSRFDEINGGEDATVVTSNED